MSESQKVFEAIRAALEPIESKLIDHPFLAKVERGAYSKGQLAILPKEEYHIVASDLRSSRHLLRRFESAPSGPFFESLVENEEFAQNNIVNLAEALGCTQEELSEYEPDARCQVYPSYFARLALHGSEAEVLVAFASNFSVWWSACKRVAVALVEQHGVPEQATAFLNPFNQVPPPDAPFDELTMDAMERGLGEGVRPRELVRVARIIQYYELWFWDALEALAASV